MSLYSGGGSLPSASPPRSPVNVFPSYSPPIPWKWLKMGILAHALPLYVSIDLNEIVHIDSPKQYLEDLFSVFRNCLFFQSYDHFKLASYQIWKNQYGRLWPHESMNFIILLKSTLKSTTFLSGWSFLFDKWFSRNTGSEFCQSVLMTGNRSWIIPLDIDHKR